jgi:hypothetical protein
LCQDYISAPSEARFHESVKSDEVLCARSIEPLRWPLPVAVDAAQVPLREVGSYQLVGRVSTDDAPAVTNQSLEEADDRVGFDADVDDPETFRMGSR